MSTARRAAAALMVMGLLTARPPVRLSAQAQPQQRTKCLLVIENVDRQGVKEETAAGTNYYAGGNVRIRCGAARMASDSVAVLGGSVARFLGGVRYEDSTLAVTADTGTYYKDGERWEARGHVSARNTRTGSSLQGPSLDYLRPAAGVRDTLEMFAVGRPRIAYVPKDSAGTRDSAAANAAEPYIIVADRTRMRGEDQVWAGGRVTIDRSDFAARADSLRLDTGAGHDGTLLGKPVMKGLGSDTFDLSGTRIDLKLEGRELTLVTAKGKARALTAEWDLLADTIAIDVNAKKAEQTLAWGHADAHSSRYAVKADSLAIDTPAQHLTALRAFGHAWLGGQVDSTTKDRDWLAGDTVRAAFVQRDSAGKSRPALASMEAHGHGRAFHRAPPKTGAGEPTLSYLRADAIVITMKPPAPDDSGDTVDRVDARGHVDGVQLEPKKAAATAATDRRPPEPAP
ncbi:MAG TPA: hypothetical protein VFS40_11240 [Gemmatimonadales bacterium]|nr:hypothetical protein [Gemmatimonadales bacterium]